MDERKPIIQKKRPINGKPLFSFFADYEAGPENLQQGGAKKPEEV